MLRITPQLNADAAKRYQDQHLSRGDYYLSESENYGRWQGQGAEMLGLKEGAIISKKDYDRLCENKRPDDGTKLTMRNKGNRRVAYDFTFSVPKDVSVLAYTTNDQRIIDAFHESCRYGPGDAVTFHKATNGFARHETVKVVERRKVSLLVERASGEKVVFNPTAKSLFDVGHAEMIGVAAGEKLLIRANLPESKLINGEIVQVKEHCPDGALALNDGRTIPATFKQFTYGYANTSHAAQGKTVDRGILIMGEKAIQAGELRQGYVSNSRFTHSQAIYTTDLKAAKEAMGTEKERKLALDLVSRRKEVWKETMNRLQVKQEIRLQKRQAFHETTKVTRGQKIDWTPIRETQKWHSSSIRM